MNNVFKATIDDKSFDVCLDSPGVARIDGQSRSYDLRPIGTRTYSLVLDGKVYTVYFHSEPIDETRFSQSANRAEADGREVLLSIQGREYVVTVDDTRSLLMRTYLSKGPSVSGTVTIRAPMPGLIVRVEVQLGEVIRTGQGLVVLEAMKMENEIKALAAGKVTAIHVSTGRAVEKGEPLVSVE